MSLYHFLVKSLCLPFEMKSPRRGIPVPLKSELIIRRKGPVFKNWTIMIHVMMDRVSSDLVLFPLNFCSLIITYLRT